MVEYTMKNILQKLSIALICLVIILAITLKAGIWFGYSPYPGYDTDADGIPDWLEKLLGLDELDTDDSDGDVDGDGIPNSEDTSYGPYTIITYYPVKGERLP
jgi:hypothetical protein